MLPASGRGFRSRLLQSYTRENMLPVDVTGPLTVRDVNSAPTAGVGVSKPAASSSDSSAAGPASATAKYLDYLVICEKKPTPLQVRPSERTNPHPTSHACLGPTPTYLRPPNLALVQLCEALYELSLPRDLSKIISAAAYSENGEEVIGKALDLMEWNFHDSTKVLKQKEEALQKAKTERDEQQQHVATNAMVRGRTKNMYAMQQVSKAKCDLDAAETKRKNDTSRKAVREKHAKDMQETKDQHAKDMQDNSKKLQVELQKKTKALETLQDKQHEEQQKARAEHIAKLRAERDRMNAELDAAEAAPPAPIADATPDAAPDAAPDADVAAGSAA